MPEAANTRQRPVLINKSRRFVKIILQECESPANASNAGVHSVLAEPQEIWLAEGVVVMAGGPGDTAAAFYIEDGKLKR